MSNVSDRDLKERNKVDQTKITMVKQMELFQKTRKLNIMQRKLIVGLPPTIVFGILSILL